MDEDSDASAVNVGDSAFDVETYMDRFEKIAGNKYAPDSLNAYRRRFRRAVELYRQYLTDGAANFKAPASRSVRRRPTRENGGNGAKVTERGGATDTPPPSPELIAYPFPLSSGGIAQLHLPPRLDKDDADRMAVFIRALVYEPQRQITQCKEL